MGRRSGQHSCWHSRLTPRRIRGQTKKSVTGNFTVSSSATVGDTRIRVIMRYGSAPTTCGAFTYGEVEDYTATIQ